MRSIDEIDESLLVSLSEAEADLERLCGIITM
jgi:hypothetical protein